MEKEKLYGVALEDYSVPRYLAQPQLHLGTRREFLNLVDRMVADDAVANHYEELIRGIRTYPENPQSQHTVCGQRYHVMSPFKEICRKEIVLPDHTWIHETPENGSAYLLRAKTVWLSYILAERKDKFVRACKATFDCLAVSQAGVGWLYPAKEFKGFPGTAYYEHYGDAESGLTHYPLYVTEKIFPAGTNLEEAKNSMPGMLDVDISAIARATLGAVLA